MRYKVLSAWHVDSIWQKSNDSLERKPTRPQCTPGTNDHHEICGHHDHVGEASTHKNALVLLSLFRPYLK